ncbi:uncharacterized protein LOC116604156 [Nematostella vectensis]|uniref:uncharacterized protein LOC116604156 n=1 Tax=Nematostella vectensis TaxID=45351 RepID=UPI00139003C1|nr:uncharacterized protein LOC116604156 [Nematostella vectensis]
MELVVVLLFFIQFITNSLFTKGEPKPVALYPLNAEHKTRDISGNGLQSGIESGVTLVKGPDGREGGAYYFSGTSSSYVEIPYHAKVDTRYSLTVLLWIRPEHIGPIFNYFRSTFGVHLWLVVQEKPRVFGKVITRYWVWENAVTTKVTLQLHTWYFVGFSYDYTSGWARVYLDGVMIGELNIGKVELATHREIRLAAVTHDGRYFRGAMGCLQIYNKALNLKQIRKSSGLCSAELIRPCFNYTLIEDFKRALNQTWNRLKGQQQISTQGPQSNLGPSGWMRGPYPQRETGAVERDLCFGDVSGDCQYKASVTVRQCFGYYVYKFIGLPQELQISVDKDVDAETLPERIFQERPRYQLTVHVFYEESNVPSPTQCVEYCLAVGEKCESFNYSAEDNGTCQLNNATALGYDHHLLANQSWAYFHPVALV